MPNTALDEGALRERLGRLPIAIDDPLRFVLADLDKTLDPSRIGASWTAGCGAPGDDGDDDASFEISRFVEPVIGAGCALLLARVSHWEGRFWAEAEMVAAATGRKALDVEQSCHRPEPASGPWSKTVIFFLAMQSRGRSQRHAQARRQILEAVGLPATAASGDTLLEVVIPRLGGLESIMADLHEWTVRQRDRLLEELDQRVEVREGVVEALPLELAVC